MHCKQACISVAPSYHCAEVSYFAIQLSSFKVIMKLGKLFAKKVVVVEEPPTPIEAAVAFVKTIIEDRFYFTLLAVVLCAVVAFVNYRAVLSRFDKKKSSKQVRIVCATSLAKSTCISFLFCLLVFLLFLPKKRFRTASTWTTASLRT